MDRKDRSAIAHSWVIGRDHMEDSHAPTLEKWTATTYRCDRPVRAKMDRMILDTRLRRPSCALLTQQTATAVVQQVEDDTQHDHNHDDAAESRRRPMLLEFTA